MRSAFVLTGLILIAGCRRAPPAAVAEPRVVICATVFPLADVVREVGGDHVRVDWIIDMGDPLAGFTMTEAERHRITGVDYLVCDGPQTEGWAQQPIASLSETNKVISLDQMRIARTTPSAGARWLDPLVMKEFATLLADRLAVRMPKYRDEFRERANAYGQKLEQIVRASQTGKERVMVAGTLLEPFLDRFAVASVIADFDPLNMNDEDFKVIRETARRENIRTLLLSFSTPPGLIADLESRTGLRIYLIDELGLPQFAGLSNYLDVMTYNVAQLKEASRPRS